MLIIHISIALISLALTAGSFFAYRQLHVAAWITFALTLLSGAGLAVVDHTLLAKVCESGVIYSAISLVGMVAARRFAVRLHTASVD